MVSQELQVLILVLTERLGDLGVLDHVQYSLSLLLELLVGGDGLSAFVRKLCSTLDEPGE